jgi:hypothetical protein
LPKGGVVGEPTFQRTPVGISGNTVLISEHLGCQMRSENEGNLHEHIPRAGPNGKGIDFIFVRGTFEKTQKWSITIMGVIFHCY